MFTCHIIDSDIDISTLSGFISLVEHITLIGSSETPKGLLDRFIVTKPDIIFISIDLARQYPTDVIQYSNFSSVIITGENEAYAYEALELNAIDYLIKPVEYSSFLRTIIKSKKIRFREMEKSLRLLSDPNDHFFIKKDSSGKKFVKVKYDEIIYVEASLNYISLIMEQEKHLAYLTMKEIEENLPCEKFIRVHKSYIVNINKIRAVDGNQVFLNNGERIIIGASYRNNFHLKLNERLLKTKRNINRPGEAFIGF
ncbi:LytR/AlgR family response regulator transcription factor [Desertivirga xinjiangensis]|uniref:LytR/AlgR family response regulator transcription factor n=1 Tax=Desertivirga xinjiangensis TaxID=539206 RepID=UPI00210A0171|nr:LytTR family DNA-binding domain-containing protein [Pedobacter xinjiangensis]